MNIFFLDEDLSLCAQYHCDSHVIKMILESAQILCTVLHQHGINAPYRPTHKKHPCVIWAGESLDNWCWLLKLLYALNEEYQYRFEHTQPHKSAIIARHFLNPTLPSIGITERPQVMPDQYKILGDPISAYRRYYANEKRHLFKYTKRDIPIWAKN